MATSEENVNGNYEWSESQDDPYKSDELLSVQKNTQGSAPVRYDTAQPAETGDPYRAVLSDTTESHQPAPDAAMDLDESSKKDGPEVCRDFLNGRCGREDCKYMHDNSLRDNIRNNVCKDYQNSKCVRAKCKYLHLMEAEFEEYQKTGVMPEKAAGNKTENSGPDICRDFMKGVCGRGIKCKYSHQVEGASLGVPLGKRPFTALSGNYMNIPTAAGNPIELNEQLKQRVLDLRKQVLELTQLNDALYSENMKLRKQAPVHGMADKPVLSGSPMITKRVALY